MTSRSTLGILLAGAYVLLCIFLIATQGLFGESFIALILGMPWTLIFASSEFGNASGAILVVMLIVPMVLNAIILYWLGSLLGRAGAKKALIIIVAANIVLVGGFFALNSYIYSEKQNGADVVSYLGTLSGEQVCLPHADTDGAQTLECALGMKTDSGEYYALDFAQFPQGMQNLQTGERFSAMGLITPVEMLSSDHWQKYAIKGILSVTEPIVKL